MEKNSLTLTYKQIIAIILVLVNLIVIGPGGWTLKTLWDDTVTFRKDTEDQIKSLQREVIEIKTYVSTNYVTNQSFTNYKEQMAENIRYLDSKVTQ